VDQVKKRITTRTGYFRNERTASRPAEIRRRFRPSRRPSFRVHSEIAPIGQT